MYRMCNNALFTLIQKYLAYKVNIDLDSCWLTLMIMSKISIIIDSEMDFVEREGETCYM